MPRSLVFSNCGTPTEKVSEFLDHLLQPVIKEGISYIKDTADFLDKLKRFRRDIRESNSNYY